MQEILVFKKMRKSLNNTFLAITPEIEGIKYIDYKPISLWNIGYKIFAKIMANRLRKVLYKLILDEQGGFMKDRQIEEGISSVHEAIH